MTVWCAKQSGEEKKKAASREGEFSPTGWPVNVATWGHAFVSRRDSTRRSALAPWRRGSRNYAMTSRHDAATRRVLGNSRLSLSLSLSISVRSKDSPLDG